MSHPFPSPHSSFLLALNSARRSGEALEVSHSKKGKGRPYSITERRVPELIPVLGSQPASGVSHKPGGIGCHCFPPGLHLPPQPLRGLLPILLLDEQRHDGCLQFA